MNRPTSVNAPSLFIRFAQTEDAPAWLALREKLWPDVGNAVEVAEYFALSQDGVVLLAERGGEVVGFAELSVRRDWVEGSTSSPVGYLEGLFVAEAHRRSGAGRALMAAARSWVLERGMTELGSDTELHNVTSQAVHAALGFVEVERQVNFIMKIAGR